MGSKLITLVIEWDDDRTDHPSEWYWEDLIAEKVLRVEVYDAGWVPSESG